MSETDTSSTKCSCDCQAPQANESASWECICDYYKQYGQLPPCPPPPAPYPYPWPWPPPPPPPFPPFPPPPPPQPPKPGCDGCSDCKKEFPIIEGNKCLALDLNTFTVVDVSDVNPGDYRLDKILFRKLEGGTFTMGSPDDEDGRYSQINPYLNFEPQHQETVDAFNIGVFPVTQRQFEKVTGKKHGNKGCPCDCGKDKKDYGDPRFALPCRAKDFVSLDDVHEFLNIVNKKLEENEQFFRVELPSDEEWEFAARAGSNKPWSAADVSAVVKDREAEMLPPEKQSEATLKLFTRQAKNLENYASYLNGDTADKVKHTPKRFPGVGNKNPNAFDLYDTLGCVWEWIDEEWRIDYTDPKTGKIQKDWLDDEGKANHLHTVRGGGYWFNADDCRCANRHGYPPSHRDYGFGFRLVLREVK